MTQNQFCAHADTRSSGSAAPPGLVSPDRPVEFVERFGVLR
ncbi:hypothetical protein [Saccharopolyspora soli]|nr:hypothetical protein [Saccharopolyspora soli]